MTQLSFAGVSVEFGATTLLRDVSFTVAEGERWGIIGRNGAGKTTIFRLLTGEQRPTAGAVSRAGSLRLSLMDQNRDFGDAVTVWEAAAAPFAPLIALEASLHEQANRLAEMGNHPDPAALDRYGHDMERFAHEGGYDFHAKVDAVLQGLAFDAEEAKVKLLSVLSGGERGRVGLAAQLGGPEAVDDISGDLLHPHHLARRNAQDPGGGDPAGVLELPGPGEAHRPHRELLSVTLAQS